MKSAPLVRPALLAALADRVLAQALTHPARIAIDGVDAAGKTRLADELAAALAGSGRPVLRASIDGFHHPRPVRYRLGPDSPEGYYADSFDLPALRRLLLDPLGPGGDRRVTTAIFDFRSDQPAPGPIETVPQDAILLFDGVFLQRPELAGAFDMVLFVKVSFATVLARAGARDAALLGGPAAVEARYRARYIPAQQRYLAEHRPEARADLVIMNDEPARPALVENHR